MPRKILALSERYYRRMLYGCSILLSVAIASALLFFAYSAFEQFRERQMGIFVSKREQIKSEVDRLSARVTQFSEMYGRLQRLYQKDFMPIGGYAHIVDDGAGISETQENLTVVPFSLVTRYDLNRDQRRLAGLLLLLRQASALPMFNPAEPGITLDGFICTADHGFLAISPPLSDAEKIIVKTQGRQHFIDGMSGQVDMAFARESESAASAQGSSGQKIIWMGGTGAGPLGREAVTRLAVRIFLETGDIATAVFSVPRNQFRQFFMRNERTPGLFVLDGKRGNGILGETDTPKEAALAQQVKENAGRIVALGGTIHYFQRDGVFFITQEIEGPGWNVVYAFDWKDVLKGLHGDFTTGAFWGLFAVFFVWAATLYFDKFVIGPLREKALALIETQNFSQTIIDTLPVGIVVYASAAGEVVLQNTVAAQMLEYSSISHADFYSKIVNQCQLAGSRLPGRAERSVIEAQLKLHDGGTNYIDVVWSHTRFAGQDVVLLGLIDMNMHKAHESLMLEAKSAADRANQAKSLFLAQVSHEIRTPLHGAIGHMELLAREDLPKEQRKRIELIRHSFDMLMGLVNDILDITKIESKAIRLKLAPISVNDLMEQCAQLFAPLALNKGLQFFCLPDPALEPLKMGDEQRLMQILQNLVGNAVKFTEQGSISLSARAVQRSDGRAVVRFEVGDTGIGITPEAQQRIFEALEQADDTISRRFGGTGLGLSLCRHLVDLMHGDITLSSQLGEGSLFAVEIPLPECGAENDGAILEAVRTPLQGRIVELECDAPALRNMLSAYLRTWGAQLRHNAPQSPVDVCLVAQDCLPRLPNLDMPASGPRTVVLTTDTSRQPPYVANRYYVSAFDRRAWLRTLVEAPAAIAQKSAAREVQRDAVSPLDILVAEDDHVNLALIEHQLNALGYADIRLAKDGEDALRQWTERRPDVLITDLGMPRLDGLSLAREIRRLDPAATIVATTAANPLATKPELDVFSDVMYKPASLHDLQRILSGVSKASAPASPHRGEAPAAPAPLEQVLMQAFLESWPEEKGKLQQAIAGHERARAARILHRLQGGMQAMGQEALAEESLALQQALDRGEGEALRRCASWLDKIDHLYMG